MTSAMAMPMGLILSLLLALWAPGCSEQPRNDGPMSVVVTIPSLKGIVAPLLPADAQVRVLMPPGQSEHGYEFTAQDLAAATKADLLIYVGLGLEPKIEEFARRRASKHRVDISFAQAVGIASSGGSHDHDHGHDHEGHDHGDHDDHDDHGHSHGEIDPHLWLDPLLVEKLVPALQSAVETAQKRRGGLNDQEKQRISAAAEQLQANVHALWEEGERKLKPLAGQSIVTHHAAWERLAERYGLKVAAVIRPIESLEPTPAAIQGAVEAIRKQGVKAIFVEPQFSATAADRIREQTGVKVATLDPVGDGDWFTMMRANFTALADALGENRPAEAPR